ncbi:hypothetical protein GW7_01693 [Heterocephalus glaber]|uniref:Uncharacterized protein n=1 Tax=Heterocephalus glaber TaxID=10181 RepID=G5C2Y8_HETGA|nr:hypothetical protein GW7_01693 [Heterocephalus glaber]
MAGDAAAVTLYQDQHSKCEDREGGRRKQGREQPSRQAVPALEPDGKKVLLGSQVQDICLREQKLKASGAKRSWLGGEAQALSSVFVM